MRWLLTLLFLIGASIPVEAAVRRPAQPRIPSDLQRPSIQRLMAGFLSEFPAYVTWPEEVFEDHPDTLYIGFIGENPLGAAGRDYLEGRFYINRNYVIDLLKEEDLNPDTLTQYQILYFGNLETDQLKKVLKMVADKPVLTVGETPNFLLSGGIVQFNVKGNAVTFTVSIRNGQTAGLLIDSRLITYGMTM